MIIIYIYIVIIYNNIEIIGSLLQGLLNNMPLNDRVFTVKKLKKKQVSLQFYTKYKSYFENWLKSTFQLVFDIVPAKSEDREDLVKMYFLHFQIQIFILYMKRNCIYILTILTKESKQ